MLTKLTQSFSLKTITITKIDSKFSLRTNTN